MPSNSAGRPEAWTPRPWAIRDPISMNACVADVPMYSSSSCVRAMMRCLRIDQRHNGVRCRLLLSQQRREALGPDTRAKDRVTTPRRTTGVATINESAGDIRQLETDWIRSSCGLPPSRAPRAPLSLEIEVRSGTPSRSRPFRIREENGRPLRLVWKDAVRQALKRLKIRPVQGVEFAEHVEGGSRLLEILVDGDRDRPNGRDVLVVDVGELAAPRPLHRQTRRTPSGATVTSTSAAAIERMPMVRGKLRFYRDSRTPK